MLYLILQIISNIILCTKTHIICHILISHALIISFCFSVISYSFLLFSFEPLFHRQIPKSNIEPNNMVMATAGFNTINSSIKPPMRTNIPPTPISTMPMVCLKFQSSISYYISLQQLLNDKKSVIHHRTRCSHYALLYFRIS